jgi:succinyl-diaminopimelate desuccinylase
LTGPTTDDLGARLLARTLALVDVRSVSEDEAAILAFLREILPGAPFRVADDRDAVLFLAPQRHADGRPFVIVAGHVDTVPPNGNVPGRLDGGAVVGRGAADMKGALAVMVELASVLAGRPDDAEVDVGFLFFGREELPITRSALLPLFDRCAIVRDADLAIVMEPTANAIEIGCLGNLNARITVRGAAAHTARPWLGRNAIHDAFRALGPIVDLAARDVDVDGLIYREVVSITSFTGGIAGNVVPDQAEAQVNFRYAPTRSPDDAEAHLRGLVEHEGVALDVIGNAPPGPVTVRHPLVERLQGAGGLELRPKQAWTPVAEFASIGVTAVNFGPGDPQYAHRDDERVDAEALVRSYEVLRAFLAAREVG